MKRASLVLILMTSIGLLIGTPAVAATTTTTTSKPTCTRSDVKVTSPITVHNLTATASFQLLNGCHLPIGLASYTNVEPRYDEARVGEEKFFDASTGHFAADGQSHTLSVTIPNCYYEVDLFFGDVIEQFSITHQYLGELLAAVDAGTSSCDNVTSATSGRSTTTTASLPTSGNNVSTNASSSSGTRVSSSAASTQGAQTASATDPRHLAETGMPVENLVILGFALIIVGGALQRRRFSKSARN